MSTQPLVSIIVPTRNSMAFLPACLQSIKDQTYPHIELIVVDRDSSDGTKEIAKKYTHKVFNWGPERSAQRNYGASQAAGEYVVCIDSDMELDSHVISDAVKVATQTKAVAVVIPEESFGEGFWAQCKKLERSFYVGVHWMEAARFFSIDAYKQVGGYNQDLLSGEDWDLAQRVGKLGVTEHIDSYIYHNEGKLLLGKTLRKKYYYAKQFAKYLHANAQTSQTKSQAGIVARYTLFLRNPKQLFKQPHIGLGMLFMKTCEFGFGGVGYLLHRNKQEGETA